MAKIYYVKCPECDKKYYIDNILLEQGKEDIKMKCPYCKKAFIKKREDVMNNQDQINS